MITYALAKILGLALLVLGIYIVVNWKTIPKTIDNMQKNPWQLYLLNIIRLTIGLTVVVLHNVWVADWPLFITLIGWLVLLKGIIGFLFQEHVKNLVKESLKNIVVMQFWVAFIFIVAFVLVFNGFLSI